MQTAENLEGDSLRRYDKIIDLLINDLGYIKINDYDKDGIHYWVFNKKENNEITEIVLDEDTILSYELISIEDKIKRIEESLDKHNFLESLRNYLQ
jgi:hypothetical protein